MTPVSTSPASHNRAPITSCPQPPKQQRQSVLAPQTQWQTSHWYQRNQIFHWNLLITDKCSICVSENVSCCDYVSQYFWDAGKYYLGFSDLVKTVLGHESTAEPATDFQTTEFCIPSLKGNMNYYMSAILPLIY